MNPQTTRRLIFAGLALVMLGAIFGPFTSDVNVSQPVSDTYSFVESLDSTATVFVSFDFEASSYPEMKPLSVATLTHLFRRGVKVVGLSLFPEGAGLGAGLLHTLAKQQNLEYGTDYVFLGMKPQPQAAILGLGQSVSQTFPEDYYGTAINDLPMMRNIENFAPVSAIFTIADGSYPAHWIAYGKVRYDIAIYAVVAASMVTTFDPFFYNSHDLAGLIGGLRGAAEYETLLGYRGMGLRSVPALAGAHFYLAAIILLANVVAFTARRRRAG